MRDRQHRSITKLDLLRKYLNGNWAEILSDPHYQHVQWSCGNFKTGYVWYDPDGNVICRLFEYKGAPGPVLRQLREGDIFYDVDLPPTVSEKPS